MRRPVLAPQPLQLLAELQKGTAALEAFQLDVRGYLCGGGSLKPQWLRDLRKRLSEASGFGTLPEEIPILSDLLNVLGYTASQYTCKHTFCLYLASAAKICLCRIRMTEERLSAICVVTFMLSTESLLLIHHNYRWHLYLKDNNLRMGSHGG